MQELYETRNYIIRVFEGTELKKLEGLEDKPNFNWLHSSESELKKLKDNSDIDSDLEGDERTKIMIKDALNFFGNIINGKIKVKKVQRKST